MTGSDYLLEVRDLRVAFDADDGGHFHAVDGVSLEIGPGETLGLSSGSPGAGSR